MAELDQLRKLRDELRALEMQIDAAEKRRALVAAEIERLTKEGER
jgi:hypothetical protein